MATTQQQYADALRALPETDVADYLKDNSGLPGPRANLTLLAAAADVLPRELALRLADEADEYLACCGVATLGRLILEVPDDRALLDLLTVRAADERWRVREAAAIAGQLIGDHDPVRLREVVASWVGHADARVVRAGIATICEPRLLKDPATAAAALDACARATDFLLAVPPSQRRDEAVRVLRQGLGYCWSVAVAGSPESGLPIFLALSEADADLAWVIRENRRKQRLIRLLDA